MEKIKEKLHIGSSRSKSQPEDDTSKTVHSTTFDSGPGHAAPAGNSIEDNYGLRYYMH